MLVADRSAAWEASHFPLSLFVAAAASAAQAMIDGMIHRYYLWLFLINAKRSFHFWPTESLQQANVPVCTARVVFYALLRVFLDFRGWFRVQQSGSDGPIISINICSESA